MQIAFLLATLASLSHYSLKKSLVVAVLMELEGWMVEQA
jgi:hypothetical protein